jgi:hypothetical protein
MDDDSVAVQPQRTIDLELLGAVTSTENRDKGFGRLIRHFKIDEHVSIVAGTYEMMHEECGCAVYFQEN